MAVFETISNTDATFLNLHIDKATKTCGDKQLYLITHFTKQILNPNYLLLTLNVMVQLLKNPKQKRYYVNSRKHVDSEKIRKNLGLGFFPSLRVS